MNLVCTFRMTPLIRGVPHVVEIQKFQVRPDIFPRRQSLHPLPSTRTITSKRSITMSKPTQYTSQDVMEAAMVRRSHYALSDASSISDERIIEIVKEAVKHTPSAFNTQSNRAVVLFGQANKKVWKIVEDIFVPTSGKDEAALKTNRDKVLGYAGGYGTVLFFADTAVVDGIVKKMPNLKTVFPIWSEASSGMLQYLVWTAFSADGLGASLQHHSSYTEGIPAALNKEFDFPATWECTCLMPFGIPTGPPGRGGNVKAFLPIEDRVRVIR